ncbi:MAG: transglycosylase SLT domain-containing protein [Halocynthiibacter sp.]
MKPILRICALTVLVAACGSSSDKAPRNLDNACSLVRQKPAYLSAMKKTERKWGVPVNVQMAIIHQESKFKAKARTPNRFALGVIPVGRQSSAYGYAQALDGTWKEYRRSAGRSGAKRDRISDATDFIGWYMDKSEDRIGISKYNAREHYLAYHDGQTGYLRGTYKGKSWLIAVANKVAARSDMYRSQLMSCGKL